MELQPTAIPYQPLQSTPDDGYLTALSVCHYVIGGLIALVSSIFIVHIVMGIAVLSGKLNMQGSSANQPVSPAFMGYVFVILGSIAVAFGWTLGALNIYSGLCISRRRRHMYSLIVAGVNCMWFPIGTALGVFTFVVLLKQSVKDMYGRH